MAGLKTIPNRFRLDVKLAHPLLDDVFEDFKPLKVMRRHGRRGARLLLPRLDCRDLGGGVNSWPRVRCSLNRGGE
jgi:hypothetical protein